MTLHGVASLFPTRKPTVEEYESLPHFVLTSEEPAYDPHNTSMAQHEDALATAVLETGDRIGALPPRRLCSVSKTSMLAPGLDKIQSPLKQISTVHDDAALCHTIMRANISTVRSTSAAYPTSPSDHLGNQPENRCKNGSINDPKGASIPCSTQRCPFVFAQTTDNYDINGYRLIASPIHCSQIPPPGARISAHKYLQRLTVGVGLFPWKRNRKHMRDCHYSSSGRAPQTQRLWMELRNRSWVSRDSGETDRTQYPMVQCRRGGNSRAEEGRWPTDGLVESPQKIMG
jgi:hypothetical protein